MQECICEDSVQHQCCNTVYIQLTASLWVHCNRVGVWLDDLSTVTKELNFP
jgi:hypothetical protein